MLAPAPLSGTGMPTLTVSCAATLAVPPAMYAINNGSSAIAYFDSVLFIIFPPRESGSNLNLTCESALSRAELRWSIIGMEVIGDAVSVWKRSRNVIAILAVLPLVADDLVLFDNCGAQPFRGHDRSLYRSLSLQQKLLSVKGGEGGPRRICRSNLQRAGDWQHLRAVGPWRHTDLWAFEYYQLRPRRNLHALRLLRFFLRDYVAAELLANRDLGHGRVRDRKSTRLTSSH